MKKLTMVVIFTMTFAAMAIGQDAAGGDSEYTNVPVNVSLVPGASMSAWAVEGEKIINNFSLNLLAGHAARLRGFEIGGLWNYYSEEVKGAQLGGLANIATGKAVAAQFAGLGNLNFNDFTGVQFGGLANKVKGKTAGAQFGGLGNLNFNDFTGAQFAGIANIVQGNIKGTQVAGLGNLTRGDFEGAQISGIINLHLGKVEGAQIAGILNIAEKVETGFQIGLFNYSKENNGIPIGLVSYVKEDGLRVDVWADEAIFTNVGLRSGTRRFHNILFIGKQVTDPLSWTVGVGIGPHINLSKSVYLEPDLIYQTIANFSNLNDNSHMTKIRVLGGWEISKAVSIFGGLTLNSFYSTSNDGSDYALLTIRESESGGKWRRTSIGFVFGAKFL